VIESTDQASVWGTVGVSENVIEASWLALVDAFEYKLFKDARSQAAAATEPAMADAPQQDGLKRSR
jgi:2-isopropylmalate synthase